MLPIGRAEPRPHPPVINVKSTPLPEYCCAIIVDQRERILLQLRPPHARFAPAQLTCFGGLREDDEEPVECLRRELAEELSWQPSVADPCCQLWHGSRFIAQFYRVAGCPDPADCDEEGFVAVWVPWSALGAVPLSQWHRRVLTAVAAGHAHVDLA
jgi:8-oxo-dGTP pyrophosphatase MutT (NUDIX family)